MIKIRKIILDEPIPVYDITVPKTESFYANGILVHNCTEITLATDAENSFVCALSSVNLVHWDKFKNNYQFFIDIMELMDNVLQFFIDYAPKTLTRAVHSAVRERSIGLGVMGFHSYLQSKNIPFECAIAKSINNNIFKHYRKMLDLANLELGELLGSPEILVGTGQRFTHVIALAPTASNALICGNVSASIEPWRANAFRQDTLSGSYTQKNRYLDIAIWDEAYRKWPKKADATPNDAGDGYLDEFTLDRAVWVGEQWTEIVNDAGSVQKLEWMNEDTKMVFRTAAEIDNLWIIEHAADRQVFIDQAQSINLFIQPDISVPRLHAIHFAAWKRGLKTLYYCRSEKLHNTSISKKVARVRLEEDIKLLKDIAEGEECIACHG